MTQIVDFGSGNAGNAEIAVDGGADVADQEGVTCLGDKEGGVLGFWPTSDVFLDS